MNLYKRLFVSVAISILFLTSNGFADLLEKCIKYNGDINNNGTVSKFEKKMCNRALKLKRRKEGLKRSKEKLKRSKEEGKRLDEEGKRLKEKLGKLLNKK